MGKDFDNPFGLVAPKSGRTKRMSELLDSMVIPGIQGGPLIHAIAAKAVCFHEAMQPEFVNYQQAILDNAQVFASEFIKSGLRVVSGGTDNHLVLVDLTRTGVNGLEAQLALESVGIIANRNVIPFDPFPPKVAGGMRFGSPAVTSRGMGTPEMKTIAGWIVKIIGQSGDEGAKKQIRDEVAQLCSRFPVPGIDY